MEGSFRAAPAVSVQLLWGSHRRLREGDEFEAPVPYGPSVYAIWLVLSGHVEIGTIGRRFRLRAGDVFLQRVNCPRRVAAPHGAEWLSVGLQITIPAQPADAAFPDEDLPALWTPSAQDRDDMAACMSILAHDMQGIVGAAPVPPTHRVAPPRVLDTMLHESLSRALFCLLWRQRVESLHPSGTLIFDTPDHLDRAIRLLHEEPQRSVEEMARAASLSVAQFRRQFHRWFGMAPHRYIDQHRIGVARYLLASTALSVTEVAIRSGFDNAAHFCRAFKKRTGVPPTQFRRMAHDTVKL